MIQCPYCDRTLSSDGSYRVHKHRFHNSLEYKQPIVVYEEAQQPVQEPIETEHKSFIHETPEQEQPDPQEPEHHGRSVVERCKGGDGGLAIIGGLGAIAVVIILALLRKKQ